MVQTQRLEVMEQLPDQTPPLEMMAQHLVKKRLRNLDQTEHVLEPVQPLTL